MKKVIKRLQLCQSFKLWQSTVVFINTKKGDTNAKAKVSRFLIYLMIKNR